MKLTDVHKSIDKIRADAVTLLGKVDSQQEFSDSDMARLVDLWQRYTDHLDAMIDDPVPSSEFGPTMTGDELLSHIERGMTK